MRPETAAALYDMSQAADRIVEATRGKTFDEYQGDWYFQSDPGSCKGRRVS